MTKTLTRRLSVVAIIAVLAIAAIVNRSSDVEPESTPTRTLHLSGFSSIQRGMTLDAVELLLGGSAGNYGSKSAGSAMVTREGFDCDAEETERHWSDDRNRFELCFDKSGRVTSGHRRAGYEQGWSPN